jgi:Subtilase family
MRTAAIAGLLILLVVDRPGTGQTADSRPRPSTSRLADARGIREKLGLSPAYESQPGVGALKIAVLDFGFEGAAEGRGYLPEGTVIVEHYEPEFVRRSGLGDPKYRKPFEPGNRHGREMAQIVWAVTGSLPSGPRFFLLNANGPTMLRRAVRYAIEQEVDLILFSGAFEGGGNGDGRGPIDRAVSEAVDRGILWINSAGNYGGRVYNGPVRILRDGYLRLRDGSDVAALRLRNRVDENTVTVTMTWNDYRDEEDAGTDKDLDLLIEDWSGRRVGAGEKVQVRGNRVPGPEESRNPRERVVLADLPANPIVPTDPDYCYRIRVRAKTGRFGPSDRVRVLVTAAKDTFLPPGALEPEEAVTLVDATEGGEIYPPADHPGVITVGEAGPASSVGPTLDGRAKPEVVLADSRAYFSDGQFSAGSSNAAAFFTGVVAVLKAAEPWLRREHLVRIAREGVVLAEPNPPTRATSASPPPRPRPPTRVWKTPTRARLAEVVRGVR